MNFLLVQPDFPIPRKSRNHRDFLPIGLLKLASYYRKRGHKVKLVIGNKLVSRFRPDRIMITSLFTYWSNHVWKTVHYYKRLYPNAKIVVGGVYASLMPEHCKRSGCDRVFIGIHKSAEKCRPAYDLVDVDYQIIHTSRGCVRKCGFCGVRKIEPIFLHKKSIKQEICMDQLVFYDNNLIANPHIEEILREIIDLRRKRRRIRCESQCGFDGRLLNHRIVRLLREAGFLYPKIAWDGSYKLHKKIERQINILTEGGYRTDDLSVFMLYNWKIPFKQMEKKRLKCWQWGVQISDCRYRPLNQTLDRYRPKVRQTSNDYHIHPKWTDEEVKQFRRNVRRQNICVRHQKVFYSEYLSRKRYCKKPGLRVDKWYPEKMTPPEADILRDDSTYFVRHT